LTDCKKNVKTRSAKMLLLEEVGDALIVVCEYRAYREILITPDAFLGSLVGWPFLRAPALFVYS
jgi:hypothetical protein